MKHKITFAQSITHLFDDIKSPLLLKLKGGLFLLLAIMSGTLTVYDDNNWREIVFLVVCIWASCRFYYCLFYTIRSQQTALFIICEIG